MAANWYVYASRKEISKLLSITIDEAQWFMDNFGITELLERATPQIMQSLTPERVAEIAADTLEKTFEHFAIKS